MSAITLTHDIDVRLASLAQRTGRSKTFFVQEAIRSYLDDVEDYNVAVDIMERVERGEERVYSSAEVRADLGLDD